MTMHTTKTPMTVRGADGRAHLATDIKAQAVAPRVRIRPIVPTIFRAPD
jgi:hypothetical protein